MPLPIIPIITAVIKVFPPKIIAIGAICAALVFAGWWARGKVEESRQKTAIERAIKQANKQAEEDAEIMRAHIETDREVIYRYETIIKRIPYIDPGACESLSPEWVRNFNESIRAAE
jgi:hypothetical protein